MKKKQLFWVKILAGILVAITLLVGGYLSAVTLKDRAVPIPTPTPSTVSFQSIIKSKCNSGLIALDDVPLKLDLATFKKYGMNLPREIFCYPSNDKINYQLRYDFKNQQKDIEIYDQSGLDNKTYNPIESFPMIKDTGLVKIALFKQEVGTETATNIRYEYIGEKRFQTKGGDNVYFRFLVTRHDLSSIQQNALLAEVEDILSAISAK